MKRKIIVPVLAMCLVGMGVIYTYAKEGRESRIQKAVAGSVIRLHVVANSDSSKDQELKLKVRDRILAQMQESLKGAGNLDQAEQILESQIPELKREAENEVAVRGYDYEVEVVLGESYFPVKKYGDMTFPAGKYRALVVHIGKSKGHNWWCVLYPSLCFVDEVCQVVPEESKEKIERNLTREEYDTLLDGGGEVRFSFKFLDWVENLLQ